MKVAYLQALMDDRFQTYVPCNEDIATMTDMLRRVQVAAASAVAKGQKGGREKGPGDENDSSEIAVRKATEKESMQDKAWLEKYSMRMPDHQQVATPVFRKVWAQVATGIHVTGCPQFPPQESLLGVEGYTRKYKSGGGETRNEAGAVTLNFCKEKVYASSTMTKPEKLGTANKTVAALMRVLAVFELLTVEIVDAVDSRFPTEPLIHNNRGVVGSKVSYVDY